MWHAHARHARCSTCTHCCAILHLHANARGEIPHRTNGGQGGRRARLGTKHVGHSAFRHHFDAGIHLGIGNGIDSGGATSHNDASKIVRAQRGATALRVFFSASPLLRYTCSHNEICCFNGHFSPTVRNKGGCEIVTFDTVTLQPRFTTWKAAALFLVCSNKGIPCIRQSTALRRYSIVLGNQCTRSESEKAGNNKKAPSSMPGAFILAS